MTRLLGGVSNDGEVWELGVSADLGVDRLDIGVSGVVDDGSKC